ncbi:MAG: PaaI family thioesterase [Janthinobacterium lividum]
MSPFLAHLGVELVSMADGCAELALALDAHHMNNWHVTHGGVTMTLLDVVMSLAGRSLDPQAQSSVTVDMSTTFLQPAGKPGARLVALGKAYHRTLTMTFCQAEVWEGERLVAKAMGTFKYLRRSDAGKKMGQGTGEAG